MIDEVLASFEPQMCQSTPEVRHLISAFVSEEQQLGPTAEATVDEA